MHLSMKVACVRAFPTMCVYECQTVLLASRGNCWIAQLLMLTIGSNRIEIFTHSNTRRFLSVRLFVVVCHMGTHSGIH